MKSNNLEIRDLVVGREGAALTPPISLSLEAGEMLSINGSNGSGKSSLLKTMAGLLPPISGGILYNGKPPGDLPILYLGHRLGIAPEMNVYDNVALWANIHGAPELIRAALHYFDLEDIADLTVHKLSAGWQQRVALTRLISISSSLWLLDEPAAHLDKAGIGLLQTLIEARRAQGGMIAIATHHYLEANNLKTININDLN